MAWFRVHVLMQASAGAGRDTPLQARELEYAVAAMDANARRWAEELTALRGKQDSPFAPDAQIHVISVSLRDLKDPKLRQTLLHVPTAFTVLPLQVRQLQEAGRKVLRESSEFLRLRDSLRMEAAE